ncbi:hypothetical protein L0F63_004307 [Massospora cicadina]|nr:hypothetical protein L0F63_004307 [Massospora cicadina]
MAYGTGKEVYILLNLLSFACAAWVFITMLLIVFYRPSVREYLSAKMQMCIALLEMTRHVQRILCYTLEDGSLCRAVGLYGQLGVCLYVMIQSITAFSLTCHFVSDNALTDSSRRALFVGGISVSFLFSTVGIVFNAYGVDHAGNCMYSVKLDRVSQFVVRFYTVYMLQVPLYLYGIIAPLYVASRLGAEGEADLLPAVKRMLEQEASPGMRAFLKTIRRRIYTFPIISTLTLGGFLMHYILLDIFKRPIPFFEGWYHVGLASTGALNLVGLCFHPSFLPATHSLYFGEAERGNRAYDQLPQSQPDDDAASVYSDDFALADEFEKVHPNVVASQPQATEETFHIKIRKFNPIDMPAIRLESIKPAMDTL